MKDVFFGFGYDFEGGVEPGIAINANGKVVNVHRTDSLVTWYKLYATVGKLDQATINWQKSQSYDTGKTPDCAINKNDVVVEVHKNEAGNTIYATYGTADDTKVTFGKANDYDTDAVEPGVALNDAGLVVSVFRRHSGDDVVRYRIGHVRADKKDVKFGDRHDFGDGAAPRVALNNNRAVVAVWCKDDTVQTRAGIVNSDDTKIQWGDTAELASGVEPAVALSDDGFVVVTYKPDSFGVNIHQMTGRLDGTTIVWNERSLYYDDGMNPSVSIAGNVAVTMHTGENAVELWYSTSIYTDRADWMSDRLDAIGGKTLKELVLPATHDSGMFTGGLSAVAQTQSLSIYGQLSNGIRFFDLRPGYDKNKNYFYIQHNGVAGPDLATVLSEVRAFCLEGHVELFILKFSRYENFDAKVYKKFVKEIQEALDESWLVAKIPGDAKRLADAPLKDYLDGDKPAVLIVIDQNYAIDDPQTGFWVYRDSAAEDEQKKKQNPKEGDLRVYDKYANDPFYPEMKKDQIRKWNAYDGRCVDDPAVPCDLFLLSWTCTAKIGAGVWLHAKDPDRHLGWAMVNDLTIPNQYGKIINLLYVDYCQYARVSDVALWANGAPHEDD